MTLECEPIVMNLLRTVWEAQAEILDFIEAQCNAHHGDLVLDDLTDQL